MSKDALKKQIRFNMELKETEELLEIWHRHDISEWTPEAFEIVKEILLLRLGEIPNNQQSPTKQTNTTIPFSHFLSIWLKPRETIRTIVETNPTRHVFLLAMLAGIGQALDRASSRNMGDSISLITILLSCIILGPIGGIISLYIGGALYRWSGSWLGGKANEEEVRAAIAWSYVPTIFILPLWIPKLLIFGDEMFTSLTPRMNANPFLAVILLGFAAIEFIVGIWALVVFLKCLGEVHKFSAWKALGSVILGTLVILVPILCIVGVIFGLSAL